MCTKNCCLKCFYKFLRKLQPGLTNLCNQMVDSQLIYSYIVKLNSLLQISAHYLVLVPGLFLFGWGMLTAHDVAPA